MNYKSKKFVIFIILVLLLIIGFYYFCINKKYFHFQKNIIFQEIYKEETKEIRTPEDEIYAIYNNQSQNRIAVKVKNYYYKGEIDDEVPFGAYGIVVELQKNNGNGDFKTLFEYKNPLGAHINSLKFSPNGKFVSFDVLFYEGSSDFLFDLEKMVNLNEDNKFKIESIEWGNDSSYAIIKSYYSEYEGDGQDGIFRLDTKSGEISRI